MIAVRVRLFARLRDLAGCEYLTTELPPGATVQMLKDRIRIDCPALESLVERCAVAIDEEFAQPQALLSHGAEAALLPPVSGGAEA